MSTTRTSFRGRPGVSRGAEGGQRRALPPQRSRAAARIMADGAQGAVLEPESWQIESTVRVTVPRPDSRAASALLEPSRPELLRPCRRSHHGRCSAPGAVLEPLQVRPDRVAPPEGDVRGRWRHVGIRVAGLPSPEGCFTTAMVKIRPGSRPGRMSESRAAVRPLRVVRTRRPV